MDEKKMADKLIHDDELFDLFQKNQMPPSEYWERYVKLIFNWNKAR